MATDKTPNYKQFHAYSGSSFRMLKVDVSGLMYADDTIVDAILSDASAIYNLADPSNWSVYGAYIGPVNSSTYAGQCYRDSGFYYIAYANNDWVRLSRADAVGLNNLTISYVDGSIISIRANYIPEASLNASKFTWSSGYLEPSVSSGTGDVTQAYVDASLLTRDISLNDLRTYVDGSLGVKATYSYVDASLTKRDTSLNSLRTYVDGSLNVKTTFTYVDSSLLARDNSIGSLISYVDSSLINIRSNYIPDVSLNDTYFKWASGLLEPSIAVFGDVTQAYVDASLIERDASISWLMTNKISGGQNVGTGDASVFYDTNGNILQFRTIIGSGAAVVSNTGDTITISLDASFSGEVNTASNVGIGTGLFKQKVGSNLEFKSLRTANNTITITTDSSDVILDASVDAYSKSYVDSSLNTKVSFTYVDASLLNRDTSISNLTTRVNITDSSLNLFKAYVDGSLNAKVSLSYVDASLLKRDTSISDLTARVNITDSSLNLFKAYVDGSLNAKVSLSYVDASLLKRDTSISNLTARINITDSSLNTLLSRHNITETSLGLVTLRVGVLESSINQVYYKSYIDGSLNVKATYVYVDSSFSQRDASIVWLFNNKVNNSSLNLYETKANLDSSLANFSHNTTINKQGGSLAASLFFHSDQSINKADNVVFNTTFATQLNSTETERGTDSKFGTGIPYDEKKKFRLDTSVVGENLTASISMVSPYTQFSYYINNKKFVPGTSDLTVYTKSASTAEGIWFFYINQTTTDASSPVMVLTKTPWGISDPDVLLWNLYFNASDNNVTWVGNEKHTYGRDLFNHARNHAQGAVYNSGLLFSQYNGLTALSSNTDNNFGRAQVQISGGYFFDEDIKNGIAHSDTALTSTVDNPETDWDKFVYQFLGFTAIAGTGTNNTQIVFPTSRTLVTGQAVTIMNGNTTTVRGTVTITTGGTGTTFAITIVTGTGFTTGDALVVGARIPIYYIASVSGTTYRWRKLTSTDFLGVSGGVAITASTIGSATCQFNNATTGRFTNMTANRYFPVYLMATNFTNEPIIGILGQGQSTNATLTTALSESAFQFSSLVGLSNLEIQEVVPFYRLTFLYNTTAGFNQNRMRLSDATFLNVRVTTTSATIISTGGSADHALLSNRQWDLSGHYGTASYLASFAEDGTATYTDPSSLLSDVNKAYVDASLLKRDTSISDLTLRVNKTDTSVFALTGRVSGVESSVGRLFTYVDGSFGTKANTTYVDSSLLTRDTSISDLTLRVNKTDSSLFLITNRVSGTESSIGRLFTYVDGSFGAKANTTYVDSSLLKRDTSISDLTSRLNITDSSLHQFKAYVDGSLNAKTSFAYVDASLLKRDTSISDLTTRVNIADSSLNTLLNRHNITETSLGSLKTYVDASLNVKTTYAYVDASLLKRDTSISDLITRTNITDSSLHQFKAYVDGSLNVKATLSYVDASLLKRDTSISDLTTRVNITDSSLNTLLGRHNITETSLGSLKTYIDASLNVKANLTYVDVSLFDRLKESSLNMSTFKWVSGKLEPSTSGTEGVNQSYVDASLLARDTSISGLTTRINITDSSLYQFKSYIDGSLNVKTTYAYVDASLLKRDTSISDLTTRVNITDSSFNTLLGRHNITETSLGLLKTYVDGSLNYKTSFAYVDVSLFDRLKESSLNMSTFKWENGKLEPSTSGTSGATQAYVDSSLLARDVSISNLTSRLNITDSSLHQFKAYVDGSLNVKTSFAYVDASLLKRDTSISDLTTRVNITDSSFNTLLGRHNITETSLGLVTLRVGVLESSINQVYYKSYVDGSLNAKTDFAYVDSSLFFKLKEASLNMSTFKWVSGLLEPSTSGAEGVSQAYVDGSLNTKTSFTYVDSSLNKKANAISFKSICVSTNAPENPIIYDLWIDTSI